MVTLRTLLIVDESVRSSARLKTSLLFQVTALDTQFFKHFKFVSLFLETWGGMSLMCHYSYF